jgi:hypothetical protein
MLTPAAADDENFHAIKINRNDASAQMYAKKSELSSNLPSFASAYAVADDPSAGSGGNR